MTAHDLRHDAPGFQQPIQRQLDRKERRLRKPRLLKFGIARAIAIEQIDQPPSEAIGEPLEDHHAPAFAAAIPKRQRGLRE
ncbi:hypothetical protein QP178_10780 [Sphingomonas aurantiaca]|uniref:hypothetical protein n=1 Tax=Sphingomonas TaxID=13687 RepID=UPI001F350E42|nr:hypothetical protein [Sphingomonas sp. Leaf28]